VEGLESLRLPPRARQGGGVVRIALKEAFGYLVASGCALVCDVAILWILVHFFAWNYLVAATASFIAGTFVAYAMCVSLVFKQRRLKDRRAEFAGFAAIGTAGLAVNSIVIFIAVKYWGLYYLLAKCVAAGFTLICNFISRRQLLFVHRRPA
jgi:putative flippase GtrA